MNENAAASGVTAQPGNEQRKRSAVPCSLSCLDGSGFFYVARIAEPM